MKSLKEIHQLEKSGNWTQAIDALEERLKNDPMEYESVLRLSFILWYLSIEEGCMKHGLDTSRFVGRVRELFFATKDRFKDKSEYLFYFGLMISLLPWEFVPKEERESDKLGEKTKEWDRVAEGLFQRAASGDANDIWVIMANRSLLDTQSDEFKKWDRLKTQDRFKKALTGRGLLGNYYLEPDW